MSKSNYSSNPARRKLLKRTAPLAGLPVLGVALTGLLLKPVPGKAAPTPACEEGALTLSQTSGPFYTPDSPLRKNLREAGMSGEAMRLSGSVLNQFCEPISNAILDFWHADNEGIYDNRGYRLRGHVFTDDAGRFELHTIIPGLYPGRTRHIHVITQGHSTRALTTQLYFPHEPGNQQDFGYKRQLELTRKQAGKYAFDFVLLEPD